MEVAKFASVIAMIVAFALSALGASLGWPEPSNWVVLMFVIATGFFARGSY